MKPDTPTESGGGDTKMFKVHVEGIAFKAAKDPDEAMEGIDNDGTSYVHEITSYAAEEVED